MPILWGLEDLSSADSLWLFLFKTVLFIPLQDLPSHIVPSLRREGMKLIIFWLWTLLGIFISYPEFGY